MYLDNAATTELTKEVKDYIISILDLYGNPSSTYSLGDKTKHIINNARNNVAKFINADINEIIFTSSGSASNTLAIKGLTDTLSDYIMYYSPIAHKSMVKACESCRYNHPISVDKNGNLNINELEVNLHRAYRYYKPIVCLEVANSEIGLIRDIKGICDLVHFYDGIVIADFTGFLPYYNVDIKNLDVDIATFSGHKLHALKGIGVLYKKDNIKLNPLIYGSQENGLFGGTENVIGIASLGKAVENYNYTDINKLTSIRNYLYEKITGTIDNCYLIGELDNRLPNNLYICFREIYGQTLVALMDLDDIQLSTGSACNNGSKTPSNTLLAIGVDDEDINSCIRITVSGNETKEELDKFVEILEKNIQLLR